MNPHMLAKWVLVAFLGLAAVVVLLTANRTIRRTGRDAATLATVLAALAALTWWQL